MSIDLKLAQERYLSHYQSLNNASIHTLKAYESDLKHFRRYVGNREIDNVNHEILRNYLRYQRDVQGLKETTIKRRLACIKLLFRWAKGEALLYTNPLDSLNERIRLPKRLPRALTKDEITRLQTSCEVCVDQDGFRQISEKILIRMLMTTGMRVGELVALTLDDLDLVDGTIRVQGKGNRQRLAYVLDPCLKRDMAHYLHLRPKHAYQQQLIVYTSGKTLTTDRVRLDLKRQAARAGISRNITPHMLRHTAATEWLEAGLDIRHVQKLLGHHSISTTEIYTHVSDSSLKNVLLKLIGRRYG